MKKTKNEKTKSKVIYEESPWGGDDPVFGTPLPKDFLPPPSVLKKAKVRIIKEPKALSVAIHLDDEDILIHKSHIAGLSPEGLIAGVLHDFLHGKLVRPNG